MKNIFAIICALIISLPVSANDEKIVESKISNVTVYAQGAQIFRSSSYSIGKGITKVVIEGISPRIDPKSLQVKATGNVILLDSKYSLYYPKPEEINVSNIPASVLKKMRLLEDSIETMGYTIQGVRNEIDVLQTSKSILANNGAIRGQGKVNDSIGLLKDALNFYMVKMTEINSKLLTFNRELADKRKELSGMEQRLTDLRNFSSNNGQPAVNRGPRPRITITLSAENYAKGNLDVSYLVSQAGWVPMYDLRSEIENGSINLNYKAQVYQNTGVDWEDVRLSISTNNPYQNKTKPTLHPWYVDYYNANYGRVNGAYENKSDLKKKAESLGYGQPQMTAQDSYTYDSAPMNEVAVAQYSNQFVEVIDHTISAEFKIDLPYSIKSNNEQHMVLVKNVDLDADYKYYTVPKYDQSAYLVAQLTKLDELQLVPAKANIFFDGSYIGETYLDPSSMDDTLQLSLGKDPNIIVKRTLLEHECKEKVVGTKTDRTYAYSIEVKNLKSKSIDLVIQDQIPITQNADIEINAIDLDKGELNKKTGIVEWKFSIKPGGKKEIEFKYGVKHDKDKNVVL